jgi:hypothetical protein
MSTFNKLFIGSVLSAVLLVVVHTGAWAIRSARSIDSAQALEVASATAVNLGGASVSKVKPRSDSCATTSHSNTR